MPALKMILVLEAKTISVFKWAVLSGLGLEPSPEAVRVSRRNFSLFRTVHGQEVLYLLCAAIWRARAVVHLPVSVSKRKRLDMSVPAVAQISSSIFNLNKHILGGEREHS